MPIENAVSPASAGGGHSGGSETRGNQERLNAVPPKTPDGGAVEVHQQNGSSMVNGGGSFGLDQSITVADSPAAATDLPAASATKKTDGSASFLRAARAGNLDKVLEFLKASTDINTCNANGLNALHLASKEGHAHVVSALIEKGANVDSSTKKGNTALHIASLAGQEEIVRILVESNASVNTQSQNGFTPLYMAAQENHDSVVKYLLSHGANQSLATEDGFTPLAVALQQGHDKVVAVLLENDTRGKVRLPALHIAAKKDDTKAATLLLHTDHNPDVTSKSGFTPLHIASHYGNDNIAALLIQRKADVNFVAKHQITPLHVASKWGKGNMVSLLLDKGANIESKTRDGLTPLHCAARSGHETVVDMLLEKGAPITAKTKNGLAPLHMSSQGDHVDAARILLYHKAPVDDVTVDFLTALHVAAHCGHVRVAKLLLDRKADPNARALNGFTPLHIACKKNRIKVVELLLKHGASIEATTESGLTPLHVASFMGCMNIVIYLIQHGASADIPTVRGETPLHLAARANQTDIIRILLRNGAEVDARAREQQTALHIASRLGNSDIVVLLLQHGANVDAATKDSYTPLHIAAKEGQEEVASVLLEHGASLSATTKKGFTPLHLAAKYGNMKVARLLLQKDAAVDPQGKNGVTPLHVAAHYDHQNVALLLLDKGASPHATAKNGYTPLHIAARKNQMDIATTLLEYGASSNAESKAGFTPLHLSAQEGHSDMSTLLMEHDASPGVFSKNGLTPLHLCSQEDRVNVGAILVKNGAEIDPKTKAGYTPLHVAAHFGQMNMVRFLLQHGSKVDAPTQLGYTSLHQAAQQGHTQVVNLLLENKAEPNMETNDGKTALSIAQRLGYISVVETLKIVTETRVTTNTTTTTEEKYKVVVPETMHETFMSESEDEGGDDTIDAYGKAGQQHVNLPYYEGQFQYTTDDTMLGDQSYRYLTVDEMKSLGDDSLPIDVTRDEKMDVSFTTGAAPADTISPQHKKEQLYSHRVDNVDISRPPVLAGPESLNTTMNTTLNMTEEPLIIPLYFTPKESSESPDKEDRSHSARSGQPPLSSDTLNGWEQFLVSFMVDARGGAMRGCRHSGVRVIIPPRKAAAPMRITCRYLKKDKLVHAPPLMEGEALASRILEMGPSGAKFLGPVIIEVPHFASIRGKEREIVILRSDNGETWREHTLEATEEAVQEVLNESFDGEELKQLEDLNTNRITRVLTTDFPQYFAIVTRIRQEVHAIGPEGGMVSSTVVPQVQAVFPQGALTKKIKVGLQAQPISPDLVAKLLGNRVAVSSIVTVEPRRRKFHKPITLTIPVPQAASKGMINQYSGEAPTLRLLCSITGGTTRAQWEDVTGSTPLTFVNDCVSFTTTVSARFWLMDCTNIPEATKMATELYREAIHVPFMAKFVVFSKRHQIEEARVRVFCMTDDKEDKTLETQENFSEVAKSRDVEVLEGKSQYLEFAGNLIPVTKSGDQLGFNFYAFKENRLPFTVRVKDQNAEPVGRLAFMRQPKVGRGDPPQNPICTLNLSLPENVLPEPAPSEPDLLALEKKYTFLSISKTDTIHKADLRLSDISNMLGLDWVYLAKELDISDSDTEIIKSQYPNNAPQQAIVMLRLWMQTQGNKATGNSLEKGLRAIGRVDIVDECISNLELVTDDNERAVASKHIDQPKDSSAFICDASMDVSYDEKDIMKDAESAEEEEESLRTSLVQLEAKEIQEEFIEAKPRTSSQHLTSQVVIEDFEAPSVTDPQQLVSVQPEMESEIVAQDVQEWLEAEHQVYYEQPTSHVVVEGFEDKPQIVSQPPSSGIVIEEYEAEPQADYQHPITGVAEEFEADSKFQKAEILIEEFESEPLRETSLIEEADRISETEEDLIMQEDISSSNAPMYELPEGHVDHLGEPEVEATSDVPSYELSEEHAEHLIEPEMHVTSGNSFVNPPVTDKHEDEVETHIELKDSLHDQLGSSFDPSEVGVKADSLDDSKHIDIQEEKIISAQPEVTTESKVVRFLEEEAYDDQQYSDDIVGAPLESHTIIKRESDDFEEPISQEESSSLVEHNAPELEETKVTDDFKEEYCRPISEELENVLSAGDSLGDEHLSEEEEVESQPEELSEKYIKEESLSEAKGFEGDFEIVGVTTEGEIDGADELKEPSLETESSELSDAEVIEKSLSPREMEDAAISDLEFSQEQHEEELDDITGQDGTTQTSVKQMDEGISESFVKGSPAPFSEVKPSVQTDSSTLQGGERGAEMKIRTRRKRKKKGGNLYSPDDDLKLDKDGFVSFSSNSCIASLRKSEFPGIPNCAKNGLLKNCPKNVSGIVAEAAITDTIISPFDRHRPTSLSITSNSSESDVNEKATTNDSNGETEHVKHSNHISTQSDILSLIAEPALFGNAKRGATQSSHCTPRSNALIKIKVEKRVAGNCSARERTPTLCKGVAMPQDMLATSQNSSDNYSVEDEVLGLMAEMREATNEIKQDVRQLRNSETPTPDTPTPLREFRDFLNREEEQEVGRLPTISEMIRESEEDVAVSSLAGEDDNDFSSVKNPVGLSSIPSHYNAFILPSDSYPDSQFADAKTATFSENTKNSDFQMPVSRFQHSKTLSKNCLTKWRQQTAKHLASSYECNKCKHGESFKKHWCECNTCGGDWNHNRLRNEEKNYSVNKIWEVPEVAPGNNSQNRLITQLLQSLSCSSKNAICERHCMIENAARQVSVMLSDLEVEIQSKRAVNIDKFITQLDDLKLSLQSMPTTIMLKSY